MGHTIQIQKGEMHVNTHKFLGYDKVDGKLVINEREAKIVRRIYREFLWGQSPQEIAKGLEDEGLEGCMGSKKWYPSTVINILKTKSIWGMPCCRNPIPPISLPKSK